MLLHIHRLQMGHGTERDSSVGVLPPSATAFELVVIRGALSCEEQFFEIYWRELRSRNCHKFVIKMISLYRAVPLEGSNFCVSGLLREKYAVSTRTQGRRCHSLLVASTWLSAIAIRAWNKTEAWEAKMRLIFTPRLDACYIVRSLPLSQSFQPILPLINLS